VTIMEDKIHKETCSKCNGKEGYVERSTLEMRHRGMIYKIPGPIIDTSCTKCLGEGKVDWIKNCIGE